MKIHLICTIILYKLKICKIVNNFKAIKVETMKDKM